MRALESFEAVQVVRKSGHTVHWREAALSSGGEATGKFWTHISNGNEGVPRCGLSYYGLKAEARRP